MEVTTTTTTRKPRYNEKVDRNEAIYQDRLNGLSWYLLSQKYNLSIKTIHNIVKRLQEREVPKSE